MLELSSREFTLPEGMFHRLHGGLGRTQVLPVIHNNLVNDINR